LITAALSVTKNAGTNYFNSGSAELATLEVDYFVYVGYNATDGITLGFSRLPYATTYGDFNTTNTNDRYCAISNITTAASTDVYELVGRFNAILSATANFFWSIPGTSIIVNHPITDTRWLTWTPTVTSGAGTYTTIVKVCRYQISYNRVSFSSDITVSNKGTASGFMALTPPITITIAGGVGGNEYVATSGRAISALISVGSNAIIETLYDATTLWTNTWEPMILGFYRLV
jgi:hypothetical protein